MPEPAVKPDDVLIETAATSVNPIDCKIRSGFRQKSPSLILPAILGKDVSGVVKAVGSNVKDFRPGDRVIALSDATYAEFVVVSAADTAVLPNGMDLTDAAAIPLVSLTGAQLVRLATQASAGQTILVTGALGGVGRAAVHAAKKLGARVIAGVRERQLIEAEALGVAGMVALDRDDAVSTLEGLDGVADTVGGIIGARLVSKLERVAALATPRHYPTASRCDILVSS